MNNHFISFALLGILFASANITKIGAQEPFGIGSTTNSSLPITGAYESTDGDFNFKNYEIEAERGGKCYTEFWLLPAKYADGNYTTFTVYVNGEKVGKISPKTGNWQSARIEGVETIALSEGKNVISIATAAPEIPAVETLKVAANDLDACISSEAYDEYLEGAKEEILYDDKETPGISLIDKSKSYQPGKLFSNVPLNYTFYNIFGFDEGQNVMITTSSSAPHIVDIIYYGSYPTVNPGGPIIGPIDPPGTYNSIGAKSSKASIVAPYNKTELNYIHPTSAEMQGYGWLNPSEEGLFTSKEEAYYTITIPKSGRYLVRVHHLNNGATGVANVEVKILDNNKSYEYEDVPISYSYRQWSLPADNKEYAVMTKCKTSGTDDPYLFIHGADCDRIVGYNDDVAADVCEQYGLSKWDSYISQVYDVKTSGISVNNYNSSRPVSSCDIYYCQVSNNVQTISKAKSKTSDGVAESKLSASGTTIKISCDDNLKGSLSVVADAEIKNISVFDIVGNSLCNVRVADSSVSIPVSSLNISQSGVYVVRVETVNGVLSRKIVVK